MEFPRIYSAAGMMELIQEIGFLPLLDSGIEGFLCVVINVLTDVNG